MWLWVNILVHWWQASVHWGISTLSGVAGNAELRLSELNDSVCAILYSPGRVARLTCDTPEVAAQSAKAQLQIRAISRFDVCFGLRVEKLAT
jgi:hypothetical protein